MYIIHTMTHLFIDFIAIKTASRGSLNNLEI